MIESRKLAAILAADVVGFSRLAGADEDRTLARLRALRSDLLEPTISVHNGRIVKRTGDGALVEFRSVVDAVRCAIEVQNGMIERNAGLPPERRIEFRIGIHLGDVVEESDGDLMGDGVNIAARLEGIAAPGAIWLSEDAYRQVKARLEIAVIDLGDTRLKNIAEPVRVYSLEVGQPAQARPAPPALAAEKFDPPRLSIVVLPFAHMGSDPEQEYFVDGVTESLTTDLSRISGSFVIARTTAFAYKGKAFDVTKIGREMNVAVVHPVDEASLMGAVEAAREDLIEPVLVGPERKIRQATATHNIDIDGYQIVSTEHSHAAAAKAVAMARSGEVEALMKGALHTDELMHEVVATDTGLRTSRRISHVFAIDAPAYARPLFITDAAVNIFPDLTDKRDIVQNAIDLVTALGIITPRVAILSAVETVSPDIRSTIDAAALCKMADRGQIVGGILDGPLGFDNAVSLEAARTKGIVSPVEGQADILVVPDLEAGNMLAKQLVYLADAEMAGIVLGARVPIMLTSRADNTLARLGSCAIALILSRSRRAGGRSSDLD